MKHFSNINFNWFIALFGFLFLGIFSCGSNKEESNADLINEVIAIHDEVMPKMSELKSYVKQISERIIDLSQDSVGNAVQIEELKALEQELDDSYEGMFVWMRQFKTSYDDMSEEEIKEYLLHQKVLVEKVNSDIKKSIEKSQQILVNIEH